MGEKKITSRKQQAIDTKLRIYENAIGLIIQKGYDSVSIKLICKESELSIGAFYHHFKSKDDLLIFGMNEIKKYLLDYVKNYKPESYLDEYLSVFYYIAKLIMHKYNKDVLKHLMIRSFKSNSLEILDNLYPHEEMLSLIKKAQYHKELRSDLSVEKVYTLSKKMLLGSVTHWYTSDFDGDLNTIIKDDLYCLLKEK